MRNRPAQQKDIELTELKTNINHLPPESVLEIFTLLDSRSLRQAGQTCRLFRALSSDDGLWRLNVQRDFPLADMQRGPQESFAALYQRLALEKKNQIEIYTFMGVTVNGDNSLDTGWFSLTSRISGIFSKKCNPNEFNTLEAAKTARSKILMPLLLLPSIVKLIIPSSVKVNPSSPLAFDKDPNKNHQMLMQYIQEIFTFTQQGMASFPVEHKEGKPYKKTDQRPSPANRR